MHPKQFLDLAKKAVTAWSDDFAPSMGAAISYYTVFSLAPLLVIVIAVAGALFGREAVQGEIVAQLSGFIGRDGGIESWRPIFAADKLQDQAFKKFQADAGINPWRAIGPVVKEHEIRITGPQIKYRVP